MSCWGVGLLFQTKRVLFQSVVVVVVLVLVLVVNTRVVKPVISMLNSRSGSLWRNPLPLPVAELPSPQVVLMQFTNLCVGNRWNACERGEDKTILPIYSWCYIYLIYIIYVFQCVCIKSTNISIYREQLNHLHICIINPNLWPSHNQRRFRFSSGCWTGFRLHRPFTHAALSSSVVDQRVTCERCRCPLKKWWYWNE